MARNRDDFDKFQMTSMRDSSIGLLKLLLILIFFVTGVVIGLTSNSHITWYFSLQAEQRYNSYALAPSSSSSSNNSYNTIEKLDCSSIIDDYVHPKTVTHSMSDDELFWRASMVPKKEEYPFTRVPTVAFMFLTKGSLPFIPLWERFFNGHEKLYSIYVHSPPGFDLNVSTTSPFYNRQIPSQIVEWGSVTLVDGERRLLANALLDFSNERFVLLSESCIPIYNFSTVYNYLTGSLHSFVESYDDPSRYGRGRYSRSMRPTIKLSDWRKGSQWFEIHRSIAVAIVSDTKYYDIFRKYCKPSCYPDEHYIPTLLNMLYGSLNSNRTVTYVDWSIGGPHPAMFEKSNVTLGFMRNIRNNGTVCGYNSDESNVCYLFARKFSPDALDSLLGMASTVMNF
ncbi:glycosyltransferase BC10-like [Impatiens glandulifera]|uniref:glycosyltransferase BC10-like n=1 Tax=Impatiens glandulifera TaxID=253017 RepID=UPI001FB0C4A4|nr:glycosyltransferase BC10-like [Impatiens glandulifera]